MEEKEEKDVLKEEIENDEITNTEYEHLSKLLKSRFCKRKMSLSETALPKYRMNRIRKSQRNKIVTKQLIYKYKAK